MSNWNGQSSSKGWLMVMSAAQMLAAMLEWNTCWPVQIA
jgi:hypothetical protein